MPVQPAFIEFQDLVHRPVEKPAVMSDHENRLVFLPQAVLQPLDHLCIQMVGGLIQQQELTAGNQGFGQGQPLSLSARELTDGLVLESKAREDGRYLEFFNGLRLRCRVGLHLLQDSFPGKYRVLRQIVHGQSLHALDLAIAALCSCKNLQQRGFAAAVCTHQADPVILVDREINVIQDIAVCPALGDVSGSQIHGIPFSGSNRVMSCIAGYDVKKAGTDPACLH